jgi:hypothetical protein
MRRFRVLLAVAFAFSLLLLGVGCYTTQYPLGAADKAAVDPAYIGDYVFTSDGKTTSLVIRNIDNHLYYTEWTGNDGKEPGRMVGYTADVSGVTFANLRNLTDDGSIEDKFLIMRISLSSDHAKLTIQNLKDDFFKDKNIDSSDSLEKVISGNLDNAQMYDGDPVVATRVVAASSKTVVSPPGM